MSTLMLSAKLDRTDGNTPWGFRLHGGKDFGAPFTIQRVTPGSLAQKCGLLVGDTILRIGDTAADTMTHKEAQLRIVQAQNSLEVTLQRPSHAKAVGSSTIMVQQTASPATVQNNAPAAYDNHYNSASPPVNSAGVPVAVNAQYNSPINLYSVDNAMSSLVAQTGAMNMHGTPSGGSDQSAPPWRNSTAPSHVSSPASGLTSPPVNMRAPSPRGPWQPKVPTGPRQMRTGPAKTIQPGAGGTTKIPICDQCGNAIRGPFVLALNKSWCPDHFVCSNPHCKQSLINIGFVEEEGQLFCETDYEKYFAPRCGRCSKAIMRECVNALKDTFHPDCFVCFHCKEPIGTGSFHVEDGKEYCEKDWQSMFQTKCYGCQFPIEPGDRWVEALNQNWHSECFNCATCQVNLEGQGFYAKSGKPFCKKHANPSYPR